MPVSLARTDKRSNKKIVLIDLTLECLFTPSKNALIPKRKWSWLVVEEMNATDSMLIGCTRKNKAREKTIASGKNKRKQVNNRAVLIIWRDS